MVPKIFITLAIIVIFIVVGAICFLLVLEPEGPLITGSSSIDNFEECVEAGHPVMESYPRQCRAGGELFIEEIEVDLEPVETYNVHISSPKTNEVVRSPLIIEGEARGSWFFEGVFPVRLFDENEKEIAVGYVETTDDWMTENFISFRGQLEFETPPARYGTLVLEKDNPSGLPEYHEEIRIPIIFATNDGNQAPITECKKTGCSGQVCSDEDVATTCEFLPEYSCYKSARCERQADGECGWTMTGELIQCLEWPRPQE